MQKISKSDRAFWTKYGIDPGVPSGNGMLEDLYEAMMRTIRAMDNDQRGHMRAKMRKGVGFAQPSSGGKPS